MMKRKINKTCTCSNNNYNANSLFNNTTIYIALIKFDTFEMHLSEENKNSVIMGRAAGTK